EMGLIQSWKPRAGIFDLTCCLMVSQVAFIFGLRECRMGKESSGNHWRVLLEEVEIVKRG
ncbi:MAG: hypothetical protein P8165_07385, partial [Deltaproteobacteria bacterium]